MDHRKFFTKNGKFFRKLCHMADPLLIPSVFRLYQKAMFLPFKYLLLMKMLQGPFLNKPRRRVLHKSAFPIDLISSKPQPPIFFGIVKDFILTR